MMPETAAYRVHTEDLVSKRLNLVEQTSSISDLEKKINCGQIEEVIIQAKNEYELAKNMLKWKPWEPLVQDPPPNQWKWPIAVDSFGFGMQGLSQVVTAKLIGSFKWAPAKSETEVQI
ncbi:hypothetical protein TcWFU_005520 [Taenia crassiceps]|uniref:NADH dehydrogenase [ubiquinone] 1 alpha subcomplex subunit 5 n=1 Tax=Taenia crassiceps TaxID=6207 RepID=A0ABR4QRK6_9CEST